MNTRETFESVLEPGIRDLVVALRAAGINTTCSCAHSGVIECESRDPTTELCIIYNTLWEALIGTYTVTLTREVRDGNITDGIVITVPLG